MLQADIDNPFDISCTHFGSCSGCVYPDAKTAPGIFVTAKDFFRNEGVDLPLIQGKARGFRSRAKLAVRLVSGKVYVGLFKEGTHDVIDIPFCKVHHPSINQAVVLFKEQFFKSGLSVYDEKTQKGELRYIQCIVETASNQVSLSFVVNGNKENVSLFEKCEKFVYNLSEANPSLWHSFWLNYNDAKTNSIFSSSWQHLQGKEFVWEKIAGIDVPYGPSHFGQSNIPLFNQLVMDIQDRLIPESLACEFYAGMGVIGLAAAKKCAEVVISEREPSCAHSFELAKARLGEEIQKKVRFCVGTASAEKNLMRKSSVVIVDPPRKGLDKAFLETLFEAESVQQLFYVSCHFTSFQRDYELIKKESDLRLKEAKSYLFFPGTNHVETLAVFEKKSG